MPKKKEEQINVDALNFQVVLEEGVLCSRIGRTLASYGASLTNREKADAKLVYILLKARKKLPEATPARAEISEEKKAKKYSPSDAIDWFAKRYPKEAQPLLARLQEQYDQTERSVAYGLKTGEDFPEERYIQTMVHILEIPEDEAKFLYKRVVKPRLEREKEDEGLVKLAIEKSK